MICPKAQGRAFHHIIRYFSFNLARSHKVVRAGEVEYCLAPAGSHHFGVGRQLMLLLCLSSTVPSDGYGSYTLGSYTIIILNKFPRMIVHYRKVDR